MFSFYGGKPGTSFLIVKSYSSIAERNNDSSNDVHVGQYAIIDTTDKNDTENGKIYKKTLSGWQYFAQIVGPAGPAPFLQGEYYQTVQSKISQNANNSAARSSSNNLTIANGGLIPGKTITNNEVTYNDSIQWCCCAIKDANSATTTAYIGFKIPYPVIEFTTTLIDPYAEASIQKAPETESHPFYDKWNINIPAAKKGNELKNIRIVVPTANDNIEDYEGKQEDIEEGYTIVVGDYYDYSESANPTPRTIYLCDINYLTGINVGRDGTLTGHFSHQNGYRLYTDYNLKWPTNISLNNSNNKISVDWNDGTTEEIGQITVDGNAITNGLNTRITDLENIVTPNNGYGLNDVIRVLFSIRTGMEEGSNLKILNDDITGLNSIIGVTNAGYSQYDNPNWYRNQTGYNNILQHLQGLTKNTTLPKMYHYGFATGTVQVTKESQGLYIYFSLPFSDWDTLYKNINSANNQTIKGNLAFYWFDGIFGSGKMYVFPTKTSGYIEIDLSSNYISLANIYGCAPASYNEMPIVGNTIGFRYLIGTDHECYNTLQPYGNQSNTSTAGAMYPFKMSKDTVLRINRNN